MKLAKIAFVLSLAIILALLATALPALAAVGTISVVPISGPVGSSVSISGTGFALGGTYTVYFGSVPYFTGTIAAGGVLTATFFPVPASTAGGHAVTVTTTGLDTSNIVTFTTTPQITLSSTSVQAGNTIYVYGSGFTASSTVIIYIDSSATTSAGTSTSGSFTAILSVPSGASGYHTITAVDSLSNTASTTYYITGPQITLSNTSVHAGDSITIYGNGFGVGSTITIYVDGAVQTTTYAGTSGTLSVNLTVPQGIGGYHTVTATDSLGNTATATYSIARSMTINQSSYTAGEQLAISGTSFAASSTVTIYIDNVAITSTTSNASGSFTATLPVPEGVKGTHTVTTTDSLGNTVSATYTISPSMTLSPSSFTSGSQVSVKGTGFAASSNVALSLDGVVINANAATTGTSGSFTISSFAIPILSGGTHTFQLKDGSNNSVTLSFTIVSKITINPQTGTSGSCHGRDSAGCNHEQLPTVRALSDPYR